MTHCDTKCGQKGDGFYGVCNDVSAIDVAALQVIKSIPVGEPPWDLVIPAAPKP